ncbi:MAG: CPBP family intramembrane metalloprotease [Roseburia sp.]|nr:CPBP family intramembrane metalloprotease [Roseburia sp.]
MGQLCILLAMFLLAYILVSALQSVLSQFGLDVRDVLLICTFAQSALVFALPSIIEAYFESFKPFQTLGLSKKLSSISLCGIFLIYILGFPFLNQCIYYNNQMHFPESLQNVENILRSWENASTEITNIILSGNTIIDLIIEVLIIGVITGISEELFFRAGVQRIFGRVMPQHVSIWVTALIFSAMHFQFFGFIPRVLLGAYFGYLYYWTGSIWSSGIAHALNNSLVVVAKWLIINHYINTDFDSWGVSETGIPFIAIFSGLVSVLILSKYNRQLFNQK